MEKKQLLIGIPYAVVLYVALMHGRTLNMFDLLGGFLLTSMYCILLVYTLKITNQNSERRLGKSIWFFLSIFSFGVFIVSLLRPGIGWDSWQVYDMSKYVFTDFGFMDQIRQHIINSHYEMAFPPVFPCLIAIVNMVFDLGVNSSVYLNSIFLLLCFVELSKIFKLKDIETIGCISTVIIFCGRLYVSIYTQGLTQILGYYLLILLCRFVISEEKYNTIFALKCGLCCGLLLMNRFDTLAIVAVMFFAIPFLMYKKSYTKGIMLNMIIYCCSVIMVCSPWIIYSISHFNSIFITDNGRRLFNIPDTRPSSFFPETSPALTIRDSFGKWAIAFSSRGLQAIKALIKGIMKYSLVIEVLVGGIVLFNKKKRQIFRNIKIDLKDIIIIAIILGQEALFILTGYSDIRYHLPLIFLLQLFSLCYLSQCFKKNTWKKAELVFVSCLSLLAYVKIGYVTNPIKVINTFLIGGGYHTNLVLNDQEQKIKDYLLTDCNTICFYRSEDEFDFLKFSAESQISNIISPANLSIENVYEFVDTFEINYLYSSNDQVVDIFNTKLKLHSTPFDNLYKVEKEGGAE